MNLPCVSWINEPERKSPPEVPDALRDELHANVKFVTEAIENSGMARYLAAHYVACADQVGAFKRGIWLAVDAYIDACWETEEYNANAMSRKWARAAEGANG